MILPGCYSGQPLSWKEGTPPPLLTKAYKILLFKPKLLQNFPTGCRQVKGASLALTSR